MANQNPKLRSYVDYSRTFYSVASMDALDPTDRYLELISSRQCKCGKKLQMFSQRKLCHNYGRRFLRCPDYVLPVGPNGMPMLPFLTDFSISGGLARCHFEWVDDSYPEAAKDCINYLNLKLQKAEGENIFLKEQLLSEARHKDTKLSPIAAKECIRKLNSKLQSAEAELVYLKEQLLAGTTIEGDCFSSA